MRTPRLFVLSLLLAAPAAFAGQPDGSPAAKVRVRVMHSPLEAQNPTDVDVPLRCAPDQPKDGVCADAEALKLAIRVNAVDMKAFGDAAALKRQKLEEGGSDVSCSTAPLNTARAADNLGGAWQLSFMPKQRADCPVGGVKSLPGILPDSIAYVIWPDYVGYEREGDGAKRVLRIFKTEAEFKAAAEPPPQGPWGKILRNPF